MSNILSTLSGFFFVMAIIAASPLALTFVVMFPIMVIIAFVKGIAATFDAFSESADPAAGCILLTVLFPLVPIFIFLMGIVTLSREPDILPKRLKWFLLICLLATIGFFLTALTLGYMITTLRQMGI